MFLDQRKYDNKPLQTFEKVIIIGFISAFLVMMGFEIFQDFETRKAGIFFFVLAWIPLLFWPCSYGKATRLACHASQHWLWT